MAGADGGAVRETAGSGCCARCGGALAAQERLVVVVGAWRAASISLDDFGEPPHEGMVLYHERCHPAARPAPA